MNGLGELNKGDTVTFREDGKRRAGIVALVNGPFIVVKFKKDRKNELLLCKRWNVLKIHTD